MDADSKAVLAPVPGDAAAAVVLLCGAKHDLAPALKRAGVTVPAAAE